MPSSYLSFLFQKKTKTDNIIRRISVATPAPERARLGAELQQFYADGKQAEILASQEKPDVVYDLLAFLAERMLEMNKPEAEGDQRLLGLAGELSGGAEVEVAAIEKNIRIRITRESPAKKSGTKA